MKKSKLEKEFEDLSLDDKIKNKDTWKVFDTYIRDVGFISHQIESFTDFVDRVVRNWVTTTSIKVGADNEICFTDIKFAAPYLIEKDFRRTPLYPNTAFSRSCTYDSDVTITVVVKKNGVIVSTHKDVLLYKQPVMVGSPLCNLSSIPRHDRPSIGECVNDIGGYFIIGGAAKYVVSNERTKFDKPYTYGSRKQTPTYDLYTEVRSSAINGSKTTTTTVGIKNSLISVLLPYVDKTPIMIGLIFKAMGVVKEEDMIKYIDPKYVDLFALSLEKTYHITSKNEALEIITEHKKATAKKDEYDDDYEDEEDIDDEEDVEDLDDEEEEEEEGEEEESSEGQYGQYVLDQEMFPHMGKSAERKIQYLGSIVNNLLKISSDPELYKAQIEDRDHYANKRIDTVGPLLQSVFYTLFKKMKSDCKINCEKILQRNPSRPVEPTEFICGNKITKKLLTCFKTGNWSSNTKGKSSKKDGISQTRECFNNIAKYSELRKLNAPIGQDGGNIVEPRRLHGSSVGFVCSFETPEGKGVGLTKSLALSAYITCGVIEGVEEIVKNMTNMFIPLDQGNYLEDIVILRNGEWLGFVSKKNSSEMFKILRRYKLTCTIPPHTEITFFDNKIEISTDSGRLMRPLLVIKKGELALKKHHIKLLKTGEWEFMDLLRNGLVEMVGASEQNQNIRICNFPSEVSERYDYCEIHPSLLLGIAGSTVPFPNHNPGPRISYQASMSKQGVGIPFTNFNEVMTGTFHILTYPQKPVPSNKILTHINNDEQSSVLNTIVAIMPFQGFNQEDAIVINKGFIERGGFHSTMYVCYYAESKKEDGIFFEIPKREECAAYKCNRIDHLHSNGLPKVGSIVHQNDPIVCVTQTISHQLVNKPKIDCSIYFKYKTGKIVDVQRIQNKSGYDCVRVKVGVSMPPNNGDKLASVNGQKSTIGLICPEEDLPFTAEGMVPDLMINSLALPSRMTIGQLIECLVGKSIFAENKNLKERSTMEKNLNNYEKAKTHVYPFIGIDESTEDLPFSEFSKNNGYVRKIMEKLNNLGYSFKGNERMYNGITGELMEGTVFIGPMAYQRLKHFAEMKIHARSTGPNSLMTRQPLEGRAGDGGLRFGEMERDNVIGQGAAAFLKDRLFENSDYYSAWVCEVCGQIAGYKESLRKAECHICKNSTCYLIELPYATKLVFQELKGMAIIPRINL